MKEPSSRLRKRKGCKGDNPQTWKITARFENLLCGFELRSYFNPGQTLWNIQTHIPRKITNWLNWWKRKLDWEGGRKSEEESSQQLWFVSVSEPDSKSNFQYVFIGLKQNHCFPLKLIRSFFIITIFMSSQFSYVKTLYKSTILCLVYNNWVTTHFFRISISSRSVYIQVTIYSTSS